MIIILLFLHELGHFLFLNIFKFTVEEINVYPFGATINFSEHQNDFLYKKLLVASGGILVNLLLIVVLLPFPKWFWFNNFVILINVLPLFPLDGGRILNNLMEYFMPYRYAKKVCVVGGLIISLVVILMVMFFYLRIYLLLLALLIFKFNYEHYQNLKLDWVLFTTNKYFYPNAKLPKKRVKHWWKHPVFSTYSGKNNIYDFSSYDLNENVVLKDYIEKAR